MNSDSNKTKSKNRQQINNFHIAEVGNFSNKLEKKVKFTRIISPRLFLNQGLQIQSLEKLVVRQSHEINLMSVNISSNIAESRGRLSTHVQVEASKVMVTAMKLKVSSKRAMQFTKVKV